MFDEESIPPRAATKASSSLSNVTQFFQENVHRQGLKRPQENITAVEQKAIDSQKLLTAPALAEECELFSYLSVTAGIAVLSIPQDKR